MDVWRQGDLYLTRVTALPAGVQPRPSLILLKGELTGHAHRVEQGADAAVFQAADETESDRPGIVLYIEVREAARLIHEEHGPIELTPGIYRVWRQREYHPQAIRVVFD